jgi:hypothetical protein
MEPFDRLAEAWLAQLGVSLGEGDLDVLRFVAGAFGPAIAALDGVDLRALDLEPAPDFSRPPS